MKRTAIIFFLLFACAAIAADHADLVLRHGRIYTMDASRSWSESIAVRAGRIVYVGEDSGVQAWVGKDTQTFELDGRFVMPSFVDAHVHPVWSGVALNQLNLLNFETKDEVLKAVKEYAEAHKQD